MPIVTQRIQEPSIPSKTDDGFVKVGSHRGYRKARTIRYDLIVQSCGEAQACHLPEMSGEPPDGAVQGGSTDRVIMHRANIVGLL